MTTTRKCVICGDTFAVSGDNLLPPHYCTDPQTKIRDRAARRDRFAAAALTGLLAGNPAFIGQHDDAAGYAMRHADALLAALDGRANE